MRSIQHKKEAYWFYRFVSPLYDRWVNLLFWTQRLRGEALELARLDEPGLRTLDVGAGTGFSTEGIVEHVAPDQVTMLDQSPDQLGRARRKPALAGCAKLLGDAERLPFEDDSFDRYVSCGSIEYWPDPARAIAEAHRVVRPGGTALVVGPLPPGQRLARLLADTWMLFPTEAEYRRWFEAAGFATSRSGSSGALERRLARGRVRGGDRGPRHRAGSAGRGERSFGASRRALDGAPGPALGAGALAGLAFVPVGILLNARARRAGGERSRRAADH